MNTDITITVVVPVYNVEKYLTKCLESIVWQLESFDEVILVNDGSTDQSRSICERYILKYNYFKLINQENKGLSMARNVGIKHAVSEYIMFLDSDDYLRLDTVKILKKNLSDFYYDAIFFDAEIICEKEIFSTKRNIYDRSGAGLDGIRLSGWEYFIECYPQNYVASACMAVYKTRAIVSENIEFPERIYFEDNYFTLLFTCQARCVIHISEKLYQRRYRENSITTSIYSERKFIDYIKCLLLTIDGIVQMNQYVLVKLKEKFVEYISDWCDCCFDKYDMCIQQNINLSKKATCLFFHMQEKYLWSLEKLSFNMSLLDLTVLNKILKNLCFMKSHKFENEKPVEEKISEIIDVEKRFYLYKLKELPLNKICKVGIYGTGKHTEGLLSIFEKLVGRVTSDLVFIDSKKDNEWYKGWKIINYQKINDEKLDIILISSFLYEKQMLRNIRNINENIPIHTFYHTLKEDIFSGYETILNCLEK